VVFKNGGVYRYDGVPGAVFAEMAIAASRGSYLAKNIKGKYPYSKVS